ncbi:hypothetical protein [Pseudobacillus wudalianchiensis]|uniref:hypothetical protein n=1 Tax=Pseudobacillus wudalianchiensis TaxID=1743143 RepID=UPI00159F0E4D|nr:hypothetical protein [Bacillus wudalianchiensis]
MAARTIAASELFVNDGISFSAKLDTKQLAVMVENLNDSDDLELTTFQQLRIENFPH